MSIPVGPHSGMEYGHEKEQRGLTEGGQVLLTIKTDVAMLLGEHLR